MKAIILAARMDHRMRSFPEHAHKTAVGGGTLIERVVDNLQACGVSEIWVVTGYRAGEIEALLRRSHPSAALHFIHNDRFRATNNIFSMALAFQHIEIDDDIVLIEPDRIDEPAVISRLIKTPYPNAALVARYTSGRAGMVVTVKENLIASVIPPHLQGNDFNFADKYKPLNAYKFSQDFCRTVFKRLLTYYAKAIEDGGSYDLTIGILIFMQQAPIHAEIIDHEIRTAVDAANDLLLGSGEDGNALQSVRIPVAAPAAPTADDAGMACAERVSIPSMPVFPERHGYTVSDLPPVDPTQARLLVVVPYRDRVAHLTEFVPAMHGALRRQNIPADIFVVEQTPGRPFNRGMLMNLGFLHGRDDYDYFCFHDVDLIPEVVDYRMRGHPAHLAVFLSQWDYFPLYPEMFGGVTMLNRDDFIAINGFSNGYWGWGAEDDDLLLRVLGRGLIPVRVAGRFRSLPHPRACIHEEGIIPPETQRNRKRLKRLHTEQPAAIQDEGLDSLNFTLISRTRAAGFTHLVVDLHGA